MPKIGTMTFRRQELTFWLDGDKLTVITADGKRLHIADEDLYDAYDETLCVYDKSFDSGILGMAPGSHVRIPPVILHSLNNMRANRLNSRVEKQKFKIGETFHDYGCIEFLMWRSLLIAVFENEERVIRDEDIQKMDDGFYAPAVKGIPESLILIPEDVLVTRDKIRKEIEYNKRFQKICNKDGFEFVLTDGDKLIIKHGDKEAICTEIEQIYGRDAVNVEALCLPNPYLELPAEVAKIFKQVLGQKLPGGLKIVPAGKSLLDGAEYFKLSKQISEEAFSKIRCYMDYFGEESGDFSGWLTKDPQRVADTLQIEF